jgi:hypothetical protein
MTSIHCRISSMADRDEAQCLIAFLRRRIAEQQERRREVIASANPATPLLVATIYTGLAEAESALGVVDYLAVELSAEAGPGEHVLDILRILALPYATHPDYREEWGRPVKGP